MKALILLGTLKSTGLSNTDTLAAFLSDYLAAQNIDSETVRLRDHHIIPGTFIEMDVKDDFPAIYRKMLGADILLFATPIWWNSHSSEIQRVIERLDEVYDKMEAGEKSPLDGKCGGVIVTGDSDGVEHVTGNIANFFCSVGVAVPPYCSLGVIWEGHAKNARKTKAQLLQYYRKEYAKDAQAMAESLAKSGKGK